VSKIIDSYKVHIFRVIVFIERLFSCFCLLISANLFKIKNSYFFYKVIEMFNKLLITASLFSCIFIAGCGGGSSSVSGTSLSGSASVGAPMANATIVVYDSTGKSLSTTAASDGSYNFSDISSLTPPLYITASGNVGGNSTTYSSAITSLSAGNSSIANITPITDAIVYQTIGQSPSTLASNKSLISGLNSSTIATVSNNVANALANVLEGIQSGSSSNYNPISSPFTANGVNPYDKINDLISTYTTVQTSGSSNAVNIGLADKSGNSGSVSISPGASSVSKLAAVPASVSSLPIDSLNSFFKSFNTAAATSDFINSANFANLFDDNFLMNGDNKATFLAFLRDPTYGFIGGSLSSPQLIGCNTSNVCQVSFNATNAGGTPEKLQLGFIYSSSSQSWKIYGNQAPNIQSGFQSFAQLNTSNNTFQVGINFGIQGNHDTQPYNSASAIFKDKNGNIDHQINFVNKVACPTTSSTYYGLPIDDPTNSNNLTTCDNWIFISNEAPIKAVNTKIQNGGYVLIIKAYTSYDRSGTPVVFTEPLTTPLLTSDTINLSYFPSVSMLSDSTGPYLSIPNASDFSLIGSVCLSSSSTSGYCDMTNKPAHTSEYKYNHNVPLQTIYRPINGDNWSSSETIKHFFVHAQDKYGRDLRTGQ